MKFLTVPRLQRLSSLLQHVDLGSQILHARVEAYSCKPAGDDKRLGKQLERQISEELAHSPTMSPTMSPLGPLTDANTRKLLISLITTMNASFPDYDFSNLRAEQFDREPAPALAITSLNSLFLDSLEMTQPGIRSEFWQAIHETVDLSQCELYTFTPHPDSELDEGKLWSIRHFFYHRKEKKVVFIAASAISKLHEGEEDDGEEEDVDAAMSSSGGEAGGHWDEGEVENNILWDELEYGDGAMGVFSDDPQLMQRRTEPHTTGGRVREVTDAIAISGSISSARRKTKAKKEAVDDDAAGKGEDDEKRKRRKKRTAPLKAAGEDGGKKGTRATREGKKDGGGLLGVTAALGSDDEMVSGGRSLMDPKRSPSPALGLLPLAALVEAKESTATDAAQPVQAQ